MPKEIFSQTFELFAPSINIASQKLIAQAIKGMNPLPLEYRLDKGCTFFFNN
ncbi:MAG: hypothetical protein NT163_12330 [Chlorobiales bacterium]|nr:hypothetical protein [Chlorobiales bacterium]